MRHTFAFLLVASILPTMAFAASSDSSCDLVDRTALVALKLENSTSKAEHKEVPETKGATNPRIDICTITARDAPFPSLIVTTAALPLDAKTVKPSCKWQSIPGASLDLGICNATVNHTFVSFTLSTKTTSDKTTLPLQVERLVNRLSVADTH
jgi:hypothetical protein